MIVNGIAHFDVFGPEPEALHSFYARVFGWEIDVKGPGYALVHTPEGAPDGAVVEVELTGLAPASVSEHLKVLRKCGLLVLEVRGRSWIYSTDATAVADVSAGIN